MGDLAAMCRNFKGAQRGQPSAKTLASEARASHGGPRLAWSTWPPFAAPGDERKRSRVHVYGCYLGHLWALAESRGPLRLVSMTKWWLCALPGTTSVSKEASSLHCLIKAEASER